MRFLDSLRESGAPRFDVQRAIMTIVIAAVKVDGDVSSREITRIQAMCALSPVYASNTPEQDLSVINFADDVTAQLGMDAVTKAAKVLKPELRDTALAFACDMILADGIVGDSEHEFLSRLVEILGVSEEVGDAIVKTTLIRNRS
jgi:uncharacterized tellurite resistance protein B-like protein